MFRAAKWPDRDKMEKFDCFSLLQRVRVPVLTHFDDWHFYVNCKPDPVLAEITIAVQSSWGERWQLIWCQGRRDSRDSRDSRGEASKIFTDQLKYAEYWLVLARQPGPVTNSGGISLRSSEMSLAVVFSFLQTQPPGQSEPGWGWWQQISIKTQHRDTET